MILKAIATIAILISTNIASAAIMHNGDYTTINGVDWLNLSKTTGMTLAEALAENEGYRLASEEEYEAMFILFDDLNDTKFFDIETGVSGGDSSSFQSWYIGDEYRRFIDNSFMNAFGVTLTTVVPPFYFDITYSYGLYDDSESDYLQLGGVDVSTPFGSGGYAQIHAIDSGNYYDSNWAQNNLGFFLVSVPVSEPSVITLFGLGLVGLGFTRRTRQTKYPVSLRHCNTVNI